MKYFTLDLDIYLLLYYYFPQKVYLPQGYTNLPDLPMCHPFTCFHEIAIFIADFFATNLGESNIFTLMAWAFFSFPLMVTSTIITMSF